MSGYWAKLSCFQKFMVVGRLQCKQQVGLRLVGTKTTSKKNKPTRSWSTSFPGSSTSNRSPDQSFGQFLFIVTSSVDEFWGQSVDQVVNTVNDLSVPDVKNWFMQLFNRTWVKILFGCLKAPKTAGGRSIKMGSLTCSGSEEPIGTSDSCSMKSLVEKSCSREACYLAIESWNSGVISWGEMCILNSHGYCFLVASRFGFNIRSQF